MAPLTVFESSIPPDTDVVKLRHQYAEALKNYCLEGAESALGRGYELGRQALERGMSLLEIVMVHEDAVAEVMRTGTIDARASRTAVQFLAETLVPFEMSHRGFLEANRALRDLNEKLESEARRIAILLHDGAGQMLFALQLALGDLTREVAMPDRIAELLHLTGQLDDQLRGLSRELHPVVLDDLGLIPALELMVARISKYSGLKIVIDDQAADRFPAAVERCLYRVVQEALANASKHSRATSISVSFQRTPREIVCTCRDNGCGIPDDVLAKGNGGLGLMAMRERLESVRGRLTVQTAPGKGTELTMTIPMDGC